MELSRSLLLENNFKLKTPEEQRAVDLQENFSEAILQMSMKPPKTL